MVIEEDSYSLLQRTIHAACCCTSECPREVSSVGEKCIYSLLLLGLGYLCLVSLAHKIKW